MTVQMTRAIRSLKWRGMIGLICPKANLDGSGENQMQWGAHQKAEENVSSSGMQRTSAVTWKPMDMRVREREKSRKF